MEMKYCIFHIPFFIDINWPSGTNIRPLKMIKAFQSIGYEVDIVSGYGKERKENIDEIKRKIISGRKYDFLYSESSTEPTLLTEKNHLPSYPFLDFGFLSFCRKNAIPVGLFYRDIYWRFDLYNSVPLMKRSIAKLFYKYDLKKYKNLLDVLYLPSLKMYDYMPIDFDGKVEELPPAVDESPSIVEEINENQKNFKTDGSLNIFYVGGISKLYNIEKLFQAVSEANFCTLTVCCRKGEWESNKSIYEKYLNDRVEIIHKSGKELEPYFNKASLFSLFFEKSEYRNFAIPIKLFEYIENKKPIISVEGTSAGDFVYKNQIGWTIDYNVDDLKELLKQIYDNEKEYYTKVRNIENILPEHTWKARAKKVAEDLKLNLEGNL